MGDYSRLEDVNIHNWALANEQGGVKWPVAWIPRPCGVVEDTESREEIALQVRGDVESRTEITSSWKQSLKGPLKSRLAGMFSELNAHLSHTRT